MDLQTFIAAGVVVVCAGFLGRNAFRIWKGRAKDGCSVGCGCDTGGAPRDLAPKSPPARHTPR